MGGGGGEGSSSCTPPPLAVRRVCRQTDRHLEVIKLLTWHRAATEDGRQFISTLTGPDVLTGPLKRHSKNSRSAAILSEEKKKVGSRSGRTSRSQFDLYWPSSSIFRSLFFCALKPNAAVWPVSENVISPVFTGWWRKIKLFIFPLKVMLCCACGESLGLRGRSRHLAGIVSLIWRGYWSRL